MAGCHWLREKKLEMRKKKNPKPGGGRRLLLSGVRDRFRFRLFFLYFSDVSKIDPPLCLSCGPVFIGKMLHESQNWSLNFLSIFVNLIFLKCFVFF